MAVRNVPVIVPADPEGWKPRYKGHGRSLVEEIDRVMGVSLVSVSTRDLLGQAKQVIEGSAVASPTLVSELAERASLVRVFEYTLVSAAEAVAYIQSQ